MSNMSIITREESLFVCLCLFMSCTHTFRDPHLFAIAVRAVPYHYEHHPDKFTCYMRKEPLFHAHA